MPRSVPHVRPTRWTETHLWICDRGGLAAARAVALAGLAQAFGVDASVRGCGVDLARVDLVGPDTAIDYLDNQLPGVADLMATALRAAADRHTTTAGGPGRRGRAACEALARAWARRYLAAWSCAYTARLTNWWQRDEPPLTITVQPASVQPARSRPARAMAQRDVAQLDPAPFRHAGRLLRDLDPQLVLPGLRPDPVRRILVDGPGRVLPGIRVRCLPGSLPSRDGGQGYGTLRAVGPTRSLVDLGRGDVRRVINSLLHPDAVPATSQRAGSLQEAGPSQRAELPRQLWSVHNGRWRSHWSWLRWTLAEHLEFLRGERAVPPAPAPPERLIIVVCGARKHPQRWEAPAGELYVGTYHRAARRAAQALATGGSRTMILSAFYGLVDLDQRLMTYQCRLGQRHAVTADLLRVQADQLGLRHAPEVIVLAPAAYADLATAVWPHALRCLDNTQGIGDQMRRLTALADKRVTLDELTPRARPAHQRRTTIGGRPAGRPGTRRAARPAGCPAGTVPAGDGRHRGADGARVSVPAEVGAGSPAAAASAPAGPTPTATTSRDREPTTMTSDTADPPDGVAMREIDGQRCTDRDGIARILDLAPITVNHLGSSDPNFPRPLPGEGTGRDWRRHWTPLDAVYAYRAHRAHHAQQLKPPAPADTSGSDPDDLVGLEGLAEIWHISPATARRYAYRARDQWPDPKGYPHPLLPIPDEGFDPLRPTASTPRAWKWRRGTLTGYQRPGRGSSGGRLPRARTKKTT